jgi:hypothetical protein
MRYMVMDQIGKRVEVDALTPRSAREKAKYELKDFVGELHVFEKLDPVKENTEATREFFAPRAIII